MGELLEQEKRPGEDEQDLSSTRVISRPIPAGSPQYARATLIARLRGYVPQGDIRTDGTPENGWLHFEGGVPPAEQLPGLLLEAADEIERALGQVRAQPDPEKRLRAQSPYQNVETALANAELIALRTHAQVIVRIGNHKEEPGLWSITFEVKGGGENYVFTGADGRDIEGAAAKMVAARGKR